MPSSRPVAQRSRGRALKRTALRVARLAARTARRRFGLKFDRVGRHAWALRWGGLFVFSEAGAEARGRYRVSRDFESWVVERNRRAAALWRLHPRADFFLARGGADVPPPIACNIGLTNKCNLRCEICGSQKYLDETGVRRRHMPLQVFEAVAETIFPFLATVELNSQGDPLLHPQIEQVLGRIAEHRCDIKLQTNGTLFTDHVIELLLRQHGTVMLSLDAVGPKFDEVRRGGVWAKAAPGLERLLAARDLRRLSVGIYPTLTRRTIGEALNVLDWAAERGVDMVSFHRYVPIQNSFEEAAGEAEYAEIRRRMAHWAARRGDPLEVSFEGEVLNAERPEPRRVEFASPEKQALIEQRNAPQFPTEDGCGDLAYVCTAPRDYVEIGLEGQIGACCRAQDVPLGYATSAESFAEAWFGRNYDGIRRSLRRGSTDLYPLPNCEACVTFFAPGAAAGRSAVRYDAPAGAGGLDFGTLAEIRIEAIQKEIGHCFIARIPPGLDPGTLELFEGDRALGPAVTLHDDIRESGGGRYHVHGRSLYFSTSDGSDARRNGRVYALRRIAEAKGAPARQLDRVPS